MSNLYMVGYDLHRPVKDYARLWEALGKLNAKKVLLSDWAIRTSSTLEQVYEYLVQFIDQNDSMMVSRVEKALGIRTATPLDRV